VKSHLLYNLNKGVVVINRSFMVLSQRFGKVAGFIKTIAAYPFETLKVKNDEFAKAKKILGFILLVFYLLVFLGYYRFSLSGYLIPWSGTVTRIESQAPKATANAPDASIVRVERGADTSDVVLYELSQKRMLEYKIEKGAPVRKPMFYTDTLFGTETVSYSDMFGDFMFFIFGLFLLAFALATGGSFITIIFASVFMVKPKYPKK